MRITTDRKAALANPSNRYHAFEQLKWTVDMLDVSIDDREQWIDDVINEWVDELKSDLDRGLQPS